MLKINNLVELIDIANVELEHDIPDGTVFEYKNNCYVVKYMGINHIGCKGCDIKEDFEEELKYDPFDCGDDCPFGYWAVPTKLSEIETLILKNKE
ncbi:MAG: hypothetical protein ACLT40_03595 [Fusobacterium sp.]